jgi:uncharacterized protein
MTTFPLRSLRLRPGEEQREAVSIEIEPFVLGGLDYLPEPTAVAAELAIQRATTGDVLRLALTARLRGPCMRCLEGAACDVTVDAHEYQDSNAAADEDLRSEYVVEDRVELSLWARDAIADALPDQILCRLDCAGLCGVCGKNLNSEPHVHEEEPVDTRWSALGALRDGLDRGERDD